MDAELLEIGVAERPFPGQVESGDCYLVESYDGGILLGVIDGLGHGEDAARAGRAAVASLRRDPRAPLTTLIQRCHEDLRRGNGVVMTLAAMDLNLRTLTWLGVGNVEAVLWRSDPASKARREHLLLRGGVVGYQLPPLRPVSVPLLTGDLLVFTTDGISTISEDFSCAEPAQTLADRLLARFGKTTDDALALVARWRGGPS